MDTTLEMQIKSTGEETLKIYDKLINSITNLNKNIEKTNTLLGKTPKVTKGLDEISDSAKSASTGINQLSSSLTKLLTLQGIRKLGTKILGFLDESKNRTEELNLFNVIFKNIEKNGEKSFSELGKSAIKFQNTLNEKFGTNMTQTLRYQGLFQAMATNVGIDDKTAAIMSESMTKLTYDLASLYNKDEKTVAEALRGGVYAGQTKPLRYYGIDITQTSLNPILAELGINDRTINQMSQAEKELLRYIAALKQARASMGDFADTIESPANQLKILRQQLAETKAAWGNLFMGMFANILPYVNGIIMVLKHLAKAIGSVFGIDVRDYNTGLSSTEEIYDGINESAGNATKATKELKRQILGFDQINNLTTPSNTGSGTGSGGVGGSIDQRILSAIKGYDNLMNDVEMKAVRIRNSIMEWLGFTKLIDEETGEVSFKFDHITYGTILSGLAVGGGIVLGVKKIFTTIKSLLGLKASGGGVLNLLAKLTGNKNGKTSSNSGLSFKLPDIKTVLKGVAELAIVTGGVTALIIAIGGILSIPGFDTALTLGVDGVKRAFKGLAEVGVEIGVFSAGILLLGFANPLTILAGMGGFALIIGGLEAVLFGLGKLHQIEGFTWIVGEGGKALVQMGTTLGDFAGSIVSAIISTATSSLPDVGTKLSQFMTNATPFFENIKSVDESTTNSIRNLASAILMLTASNVLDGLTSWLTGGNSFVKFGNELVEFAPKFKQYAETMEGVKGDVVEKTSNAALSIAKFAKEIPNEGGAISWIVGDNTLEKFGKYLPDFGKNFKQYATNISGVKADVVEASSKAVLSIIEFSKEIPNQGGMISWFTGDNKLSDFAYQLKYFGLWFKDYANSISGVDNKIVTASSAAVLSIMEFANQVPNQGGVKAWFTGDNKLSDFGYQLKYFGIWFKDYYNSIANIGTDKVNSVSKTIGELINHLKEVKSHGLADVVKSFGKSLSDSAGEYKKFFENNLSYDKGNSIGTNFGNGIASGIKTKLKNFSFPTMKITDNSNGSTLASFKIKMAKLGGIFNGTSWNNIPQYANGGMPSHGTLFAAGENGAEIVGNINRRTEVLNRSQIASAIYSAVASAMSQYGGGTSQIDVHVHTDEGTVVDRINQKTKQTGRCPIDMPAY